MQSLKTQLEWEEKYNSLLQNKLLREDFSSLIPNSFSKKEAYLASFLMEKVYLNKRIPIASMVGMLSNKVASISEAIDIINKSINIKLILWNQDREELVVRYAPNKEIEDKMETYMFPPPLLCKPNFIKNNRSSPYYSVNKDTIILNSRGTQKVPLDVLNILNNIPFSIDKKVSKEVENSWNISLIPKKYKGEDLAQKTKALLKYNRRAKEIINEILKIGNKFYLSNQYDYRGRIYCRGYYINTQGNDWCKACINLSKKEYLSEEGKKWLAIDIANKFGLDKLPFSERLSWFEKNQYRLESLVEQAEEPASFYQAILAWYEVEAGMPTGHTVALDATSSGTQIFSVLTRDKKGAYLCNILNSNKEDRQDVYSLITKKIGLDIPRSKVKKAIMTSLYGSQAKPKEIFEDKYSLFEKTMQESMPYAWALNKYCLRIWDPEALEYKWTMPDGFEVVAPVISNVEESFTFRDKDYTYVKKVNEPVKKGRFLGANLAHSCDSLIVREIVRMANFSKKNQEYLSWLINNKIQGKKRYSKELDNLWNLYKETGFPSYRMLSLIDEGTLHQVDPEVIKDMINNLPKETFHVFAVHDCFHCHANYAEDIRKMYRLQLAKLCKSNFLNYWLRCVQGEKYEEVELPSEFSQEILDKSEYALS